VLEPAVLELYSILTQREVMQPKTTYAHPTRPFMVYSPDGLVKGEKRGVDAKVTFWDQRKKWGWDADEIPIRVTMQCWWYMAAYDWDEWDVAALLGDGLPRIYTVKRDAQAEQVMLTVAETWWRKYLLGDEVPPMGNSPDASRWLQAAYPDHKRPDLREATPAEMRMIEDYVAARVVERELTQGKKTVANQLKQAIGDREGLEFPEGRFTWRKTKDSEYIDFQSLALTLMTRYVKEPEERTALYDLHTHVKKGARRIYCSHPSLKDEPADAETKMATA